MRLFMKRTEITYGQLDRAMRSLGFTRRLVEKDPPAIRYEHKDTGALISVPPFDDDDKAFGHHITVARATLDTFGIADPFAFDAELQKAG
jgi:hypothetical protein